MQLKKIEIENPPLNDWRNFIPCGAETLYHVTAYKTGYLHDVGVELVLTPIRDGEEKVVVEYREVPWRKKQRDLREQCLQEEAECCDYYKSK